MDTTVSLNKVLSFIDEVVARNEEVNTIALTDEMIVKMAKEHLRYLAMEKYYIDMQSSLYDNCIIPIRKAKDTRMEIDVSEIFNKALNKLQNSTNLLQVCPENIYEWSIFRTIPNFTKNTKGKILRLDPVFIEIIAQMENKYHQCVSQIEIVFNKYMEHQKLNLTEMNEIINEIQKNSCGYIFQCRQFEEYEANL